VISEAGNAVCGVVYSSSAEMLIAFKGIVHPKMKMKSLITHPHGVPTPKGLRSSSQHK